MAGNENHQYLVLKRMIEWIAIPVLCLLSAALVFHLGREIVRFARARGWLWCLLAGGFAVLASPAGLLWS